MELKRENLYLLRIDFDSYIVTGYELNHVLNLIHHEKIIRVTDIANNFLMKQYTEETKISFQELYHIKKIEVE